MQTATAALTLQEINERLQVLYQSLEANGETPAVRKEIDALVGSTVALERIYRDLDNLFQELDSLNEDCDRSELLGYQSEWSAQKNKCEQGIKELHDRLTEAQRNEHQERIWAFLNQPKASIAPTP